MPRNIVIGCDGTANEFAQDRTNVVKLYYALERDSPDQIAFYHPGLGTMEPGGALTTPARKVTRLLRKALGYGLSNDIRDAYTFLMNNFRDDDRVFLFGFSRGAYQIAWTSDVDRWLLAQPTRTAVYGPVRTVVWQGSAGDRRPYADLTGKPEVICPTDRPSPASWLKIGDS